MDSNEKNLDVMTQEEIERFLAEQENSSEKTGFEDADLVSILSELESDNDADLQEISDLLNRADNNEAVDDDVLALMAKQEAEGENAYEAMDLFSGQQSEKKEGFFKRLLNKFKKKKQDKQEAEQKQVENSQETQSEVHEEADAAMDAALAMLGGESAEASEAIDVNAPQKEKKTKKKKEKKPKKEKKTKQSKPSTEEIEGLDEVEEKAKEKPAKKKKTRPAKKKKPKEKKKKVAKKSKNDLKSIRKKAGVSDTIEIQDQEAEEMPHKNKIIMVFLAAVMIMLGFLVVNFYFTGYTNKKLAEEAYEAEDYLECYQLMYGQHLNDSQTTMFHRSELTLKMDIFWSNYNDFLKEEKQLESLDELVQFVYAYPDLSEYAAQWKGLDIVESTYEHVLKILDEDYKVSAQEVLDIAALRSDRDYTRALVNLVGKKQKNDVLEQKYPDILPPEQERVEQGE